MGNELKPDLRRAAERAATVLQQVAVDIESTGELIEWHHSVCDVLDALQSALSLSASDPVGEPVAKRLRRDEVIGLISPLSNNSADHDIEFANRVMDAMLSASPQEPREAALTDERIRELARQYTCVNGSHVWVNETLFARAIEREIRGAQEVKAGEDARDAARYRWLRDRAVWDNTISDDRPLPWCVIGTGATNCYPCEREELDAAVDAAMSTTLNADSRGEKG